MKLELGGGENFSSKDFLNVDIKAGPGVDIVGNLLALFSPDANIRDYPDLERITGDNICSEIRAIHFIEHIPWIYQDGLFNWMHTVLEPGGILEIVTPNIEYICRVYLKRSRWRISRLLKRVFKGVVLDLFPEVNHPYITNRKNELDLRRWFNFKVFSGCSLGDYHHCMYDDYMLNSILSKVDVETGLPLWMQVHVKARGDMLKATVVKFKEKEFDKELYF